MRPMLVLAGAMAATLLPAASASAFAGSDAYTAAPSLLFSVPGLVINSGFAIDPTDPGSSGAPIPCPAMTKTAWWRFAGTGQPIHLSTVEGSNFDTVLAVYDAGLGGGPLVGNRIACNDDDPVTFGSASALTFPSQRGKSYLVEVGSHGAVSGTIDLRASSPVRPANDDRISPQVLQTGTPAAASNIGSSQELGETLGCETASYAATVWFRWTAPAIGDATFSSSGATFPTVVTVYRADSGAIVGCAAASDRAVAVRVAAGDYLVQIGSRGVEAPPPAAPVPDGTFNATADFKLDPDLDNDGVLASGDCNDANASIRPGVVDPPEDGVDQNCDGVDPVNLDRDHDGYNRPGDCNDGDPRIHPLLRDIPGNAIDEDCTGTAAPYPRLPSTVSRSWVYKRFHITRLTVNRLLAGSRIELRCHGLGCPRKSKVIKVPKARRFMSVLSYVKNRHLLRGSVLEVRVTKPEYIGVALRLTMRGAKDPKVSELCLPVGKSTAKPC